MEFASKSKHKYQKEVSGTLIIITQSKSSSTILFIKNFVNISAKYIYIYIYIYLLTIALRSLV